MKKMIVPIAIGLVVGLGGSVAAGMILGKEPSSLEQGLEEAMAGEGGDSAAAHETHADSAMVAHPDSAMPMLSDSVSVALAVAESTHVTGHPGALALAANASAVAVTAQGTNSEAGLPDGALTSAELAKLFASMQARDAARVLEQMDDFEVQVILGALANREAAAILSNLSPERAAVISRAIIRSERGGR